MDDNITRALEIGVAFMVFVAGLGSFYVISSGMTSYLHEANRHIAYSASYDSSSKAVASEPITDSAMYYILIDKGQVATYLDGTLIEVMDSFDQVSKLKEILNNDGFSSYSEICVVNDMGEVVEVHYMGVP